jgi:hypothetical protein
MSQQGLPRHVRGKCDSSGRDSALQSDRAGWRSCAPMGRTALAGRTWRHGARPQLVARHATLRRPRPALLGRAARSGDRAFWDFGVRVFRNHARVQRCFARWRIPCARSGDRLPLSSAVRTAHGGGRGLRPAKRSNGSTSRPTVTLLLIPTPRVGWRLKWFAVRPEAQLTTACCIAHRAPAARVDTPILV